jgi:signal transduction histidine kinase
VRAIYALIVLGLVSILVMVWVIELFVSPTGHLAALLATIAVALLPNVAVLAWRGEIPVWLLTASFIGDILAASAGIHFGGGPDHVSGPLLYALVIGMAGLIVSEGTAFAAAGGSALAYAGVVVAEYLSVLPHRVPYSRPPDRQFATVLAVTIYLFLIAWLVSYAVRQIRLSHRLANDLRDEAVSALSHDLKNPLGIIHGYAEMIGDAAAVERLDYGKRIRQSAQHALDLVRNVLDASALEARAMTPDRVPLRVNELVDEVLDLYRYTAEAKQIALTGDLAPDLPLVHADRQLIARALANLVSNAVKYTPVRGSVRVSTAAEPGFAVIAVRDDGPGISPAARERLFEKYNRAGTTRDVEGTGLGLYIVRRIAEAHSGSVDFDSESDRGSAFILRLPAAHA